MPATRLARLRAALAPRPDDAALVAGAPPVALREVARRLWPDVRPFRRHLAAGLALAAIVPALDALEIWLFMLVVDDVLVPRDLGPLPGYALAYVGLALLAAVLAFADDYLATWIGEHFTLRLRTRLFAHLQELTPDQLGGRRLGDLLSRLSGDVGAIDDGLAGLAEGLAAVARLVFFAAALLLLSWQLALAALVVVPLSLVLARWFGRLARRAARERRRRSGSLVTVAEESLGNLAVVQAFGGEPRERARLRREGEGMVDAELAATRVAGVFTPLADLVQLLGALAVIGLGTWLLARGELTLGALLAFLAYLARLASPVRQLGRLGPALFEASAGAERVLELLDERPAVTDGEHARPLRRVHGRLELRGVHVRYGAAPAPLATAGTPRDTAAAAALGPAADVASGTATGAVPGPAADVAAAGAAGAAHALRGVDLCVHPGRSLAIVGASGAGKSTLVKLLLRQRDPDAGVVALDGHDLRDLTRASVREHVAVVLQEPGLFAGSVRANVAYGRPEATAAEVDAALAAAGIADLADAEAGERGRALSGGQARRVALARALLRDAPVLVLDEPTAGLDTVTARGLREPLAAALRGRTAVLVTHDLALAATADEVAVLHGGRVVEHGPPDALLSAGGAWARLKEAA